MTCTEFIKMFLGMSLNKSHGKHKWSAYKITLGAHCWMVAINDIVMVVKMNMKY